LATVVEYLDSKGIDYHIDGDNAVMNCPKCGETEGKFGINIGPGENMWRGQCFRGSCEFKVNEITFKRFFGDSAWVSNLEDDAAQVAVVKKTSGPEVPPDPEIAHKALLECDEVLNYLNDERGLSLATIKLAKLGLSKRKFSDGKVSRALTFPYFKGKKCLGVKYKALAPDPKDFRSTAGWDVGLYMEDNIKKDMESLLICEGEMDVLALVNQGYTNVVGISGADSKKADWADLLELPKKLYLVLDNDEAGIKGAKTFTDRFGVDRFHIVNIPHEPLDEPVVDKHGTRTTISDVNEYFQIGHTVEDFNQLLEEAKPFDIEGATSMQSAFDEIIADYEERGNMNRKYLFLWPSVNLKAKGIDDGDLIAILAARKTGKTTFVLNQLEHMLTTYGINVHFECLEMTPKQLTKKWAAMYMGINEDDLTIDQIQEAKTADRKRPHHFYFTQSNPRNEDDMMNIMRKMARRYAIGAACFDNLQGLVDTTITKSERGNRPAYISSITKKFKRLANELKYPLFLISQPKNVEDGAMVSATDSEGSGALANDSDLFFTLNRAREVKMKMEQMASLGKFETNRSHSDDMYVETALSRRSFGGFVTLKIDGAKSTIREYNDTEKNANTKKTLIGGIEIIDENEATAI
jgi:KaiC/GvpD/RAD55 family RecA-like ATPase